MLVCAAILGNLRTHLAFFGLGNVLSHFASLRFFLFSLSSAAPSLIYTLNCNSCLLQANGRYYPTMVWVQQEPQKLCCCYFLFFLELRVTMTIVDFEQLGYGCSIRLPRKAEIFVGLSVFSLVFYKRLAFPWADGGPCKWCECKELVHLMASFAVRNHLKWSVFRIAFVVLWRYRKLVSLLA